MSYLTLAQMVRDSDLIERITACAASLGHPEPETVARPNMWKLVTTEGWAAAYKAGTKPRGADETAVTDEMILAAVQPLITEKAPSPAE